MSRRGARGVITHTHVPSVGAVKWQEILRDYDECHAHNEERQISWFRRQPSLRAAIETAAYAADERGKRYDHQYRIRRTAIAQTTAALLSFERSIATAASFDDLLRLVSDRISDIDGIGELYCYDTALRIGAYLGQFPTRVHLHHTGRSHGLGARLPWRDTRNS